MPPDPFNVGDRQDTMTEMIEMIDMDSVVTLLLLPHGVGWRALESDHRFML
jgi:hypothetical protein